MESDLDATSLFDQALVEMRAEPADSRKALETLRRAIAARSPHAAYALATWYLHGKDGIITQDFAEAVRLLKIAADTHHASALYDLAVCYARGDGVDKNAGKAFELYLMAALHGDAQAVFKVGQAYFFGDGVPEDRRVASVWFDRAEELGTYETEPDETTADT